MEMRIMDATTGSKRRVPGARVLALLLALALLASAAFASESEVPQELVTPEQEARLAEIRAAIEASGANWTAEHTTMSVLPREEFLKRLGGDYPPHIRAMLDTLQPDPADLTRDYPAVWDWREMEGVTPVKNQGSCGSCWDFAATGATEGNVRIQEGVVLDLSEQQGLDCNDYGSSCDGGWPGATYHVFTDPGAVAEECMPYVAVEGNCRQRLCDKVAIIDGFQYIAGNVDSYKAALLDGPISSCYTVYEDFNSYGGGCYEHTWGAPEAGHCIVIVGWDDAMCGGAGAWICKNSWGGGWGAAGYFYIKFNDSGINTGGDRPLNAHVPKLHLVPDEYSTIQNAIDNAERGDIIKIAGGTYSGSVVLDDYISLYGGYDPTFTIRDPETYTTVIDAEGAGNVITCEGNDHIVIDGFEIRNSGASSYGVYVKNSGITIRDCDIHSAWRGIGIIYGSGGITEQDALIDFCTIHDNTGAGIFLNDADNPNVGIMYSAIYSNGGAGVYSQMTNVSFTNCTIAHNGSDGIDLRSSAGNGFMLNIVAGNGGYGITCTSATPDLAYNDVWGNTAGDYNGCSADPNSISEDPLFCDGPAGDVAVHATSPTLEFGMGALGIGCPEGPQNLNVAQNGASLELSWSVPPGARADVDYYIVYRDSTQVPHTAIATVDAPDTAYTDIGVPPCDLYYYWVSAVDTDTLEWATSNRVGGELCYDGPTGLDVTFTEGGNELSWISGAGPIDYYVIERGNELAEPDSIAWVPSGSTGFIDTAVGDCPRDNYAYEVVPVYDTGWQGEHSAVMSIDPSPSPPSGITAEWVGSDIQLTWDDNCESDFRRYWIYRDTFPISPPIDGDLLVGFTPDPEFLDEGLNPSGTYFYRLVATDAESQRSEYSVMVIMGTGDILAVPSSYGTIQAAIDAASAIDTVLVSPGTYNENITMKDGVIVMSSDGRATTTISSGSGAVVTAVGLCDLTLLSGFTIDGQGTVPAGVDCWVSYVRVEDCSIINCSNGVSSKYGDASRFSGNHITSNSNGITVADSARPFLRNNVIELNTFSGIYNTGEPGPEVGRTLGDANDIMDNSYFQVFNLAAGTVDADYNYWGSTCVGDSLFYGLVDYVPWTDETHTETYTECGTGVDEGVAVRPYLSHNFPNPFNPSTAIQYRVPSPGSRVRLSVYDLSGRTVRMLVDAYRSGGEHLAIWRGLDDHGREVGSGVYFYRLEVDGTSIERKMVMLK